jgi:hypothetical protein
MRGGIAEHLFLHDIPDDTHIHVGCCVGVDAAIIDLVLRTRIGILHIYTSYGPDHEGASARYSATDIVDSADSAGSNVHYWAGGHGTFRSRVVARTRHVARQPGPLGAFVGFFDRPAKRSRGTLLACRTALSHGSTVFACAGIDDVLLDLGPHTLKRSDDSVFLRSGRWMQLSDYWYTWESRPD